VRNFLVQAQGLAREFPKIEVNRLSRADRQAWLGTGYFIPLSGPLLFVTHILVFSVLIRKEFASSSGAPRGL